VAHTLSHSLRAAGAAGALLAAHWLLPTVAPADWPTSALGTATLAACWALVGVPAVVDLAFAALALRIDVHVLMTLSALGTVVLGCPGEGALLLTLFLAAHAIEERLSQRARGDQRALLDAALATATLVGLLADGGPDLRSLRTVPAHEVRLGDHCLVRAGQRVPVDAVVVHGRAAVSTEHVTGEALPFAVEPGSKVPGGALNRDGALVVEALASARDSTPARIAMLAREAQARRPRAQRWVDEFGERYSKVVLGLTVALMVVLPLTGTPLFGSEVASGSLASSLHAHGEAVARGAVYRALGFLTTAAPCALTVATLPYVATIAALSRKGVLVKGGEVLDVLADATHIALDKTGTLTSGELRCLSWEMLSSGKQGGASLAWSAAKAMAGMSDHPVSKAISAFDLGATGVGRGSPVTVAGSDLRVVHGAGLEGTVTAGGAQHRAWLGSVSFVQSFVPETLRDVVKRWSAKASRTRALQSVLVLEPLAGGLPHVLGMVFEDTVRPESAAAVAQLQGRGAGALRPAVDVLMLTGDVQASALAAALAVGIEGGKVQAGMTPDAKLRAVDDIRGKDAEACIVMMGDGINDAPALAAADVGVAVAATAEAAVAAAADVICVSGDAVARLPLLLRLARRNRALVIQNVALAALSIVVASTPTVLGYLPMWMAVLLHEGATLLVAANSLRALHVPRAETAQGTQAAPEAATALA